MSNQPKVRRPLRFLDCHKGLHHPVKIKTIPNLKGDTVWLRCCKFCGKRMADEPIKEVR